MRAATLSVLLLAFLVCNPVDAAPPPTREAPAAVRDSSEPRRAPKELARRVDAIFAEWNVPGSPGAAVVLTAGGKSVLARCYGLADIEHGVPITPTTRFELASVSKPFTAFAVLLLEQSGQLALTDDIRKYLPEIPDRGTRITVADLLYQTSGISDYIRVRAYMGQYGLTTFETGDLIGLVARQRALEFEPGTKWRYSNTNYALLAEIVARVTRKPFGEWMRENVFDPLQMHDTSFPSAGTAVLPKRANAYARNADGSLERSLVENFRIPGHAHTLSTIDDMAKWIDNFRTARVGGRALIDRMQARPVIKSGERSWYAAGLGVGSYRGTRTVGHSGQTGAFLSELLWCPEHEVGVVVLANAGWMDPAASARRVLDAYLGDALEPDASAATPDAKEVPTFEMAAVELNRFVGGYRLEDDPSTLLAVSREGAWLVGMIAGFGGDLFRPTGPAEFLNRNRNTTLKFVTGDGDQRRVLVTLRGKEMWAKRIDISPEAPWIDECAGFYYSDEFESAYEIVREPSGLSVHVRNGATRPLEAIEKDILAGGIGILTFIRDDRGRVIGFDLNEPEDIGERQIRFARCERAM